jgi:hypothetical protein
MAKVKIAWKTNDGLTPQQARGDKASELIGFQEIGCHIIFDIKIGLHKKGLLCRWRSYDHGTELDDLLFKCCVTRQHMPRISNCGVE